MEFLSRFTCLCIAQVFAEKLEVLANSSVLLAKKAWLMSLIFLFCTLVNVLKFLKYGLCMGVLCCPKCVFKDVLLGVILTLGVTLVFILGVPEEA